MNNQSLNLGEASQGDTLGRTYITGLETANWLALCVNNIDGYKRSGDKTYHFTLLVRHLCNLAPKELSNDVQKLIPLCLM